MPPCAWAAGFGHRKGELNRKERKERKEQIEFSLKQQ
jgi:hypothetical protein